MSDKPHPSREMSELKILLLAIEEFYGYDFTQYNITSVMRRVRHFLEESEYKMISDLVPEIIRDPEFFTSLFYSLTINYTQMFRDPSFYENLRSQVIPYLKSFPFIKIWVAGCATGEEVFSLAILMEESGLGGRYRIYGTDINDNCLHSARKGLIMDQKFSDYQDNYLQSGGHNSLESYFQPMGKDWKLDPGIQKNLVFSNHNLSTDWSFSETQLVSCRNVLIYFKKPLIHKALSVFHDSLVPAGYLCLGRREQIPGGLLDGFFSQVDSEMNLYRRAQNG